MEIKTRQFKELAARWMKDSAARAFLRKGPYIMAGKRVTALQTFPDIPEAQAYGAAACQYAARAASSSARPDQKVLICER